MTGFQIEWIVIALIFVSWTCLYWRPVHNLAPEIQLGHGIGALPLYFAATDEKTEPATPHRKQEARKKGQVAKSNDLNSALVLIAVIVVLYSIRGYFGENISTYVTYILSHEMNTALNSTRFFDLYKLTLI